MTGGEVDEAVHEHILRLTVVARFEHRHAIAQQPQQVLPACRPVATDWEL
jgi:hypothetical protein